MPTTLVRRLRACGARWDVHLLVEPFEGIGAVQLGAQLLGQLHEREHVVLGRVHQFGGFVELRSHVVSHFPPLAVCILRCLLGESGADHRGDHGLLGLGHAGEDVAHEMDAAALRRGGQHLLHGAFEALVLVGDDQLNATQTPAGELAQEHRPEGLGVG